MDQPSAGEVASIWSVRERAFPRIGLAALPVKRAVSQPRASDEEVR